jgi:DMSO/TMAO reductase YedYZ heme-binding membrane subunit
LITLGAALAALTVVALGFASANDTVEQWRLAARWTARIGFPVFILTYSASALYRLWPAERVRALLRDRRWWGLGFAAMHTVHLVALVTFLRISGETRPVAIYLFAGGGYAILYAMALTSNAAAMRALGRNWKRLHTLGIHWLWTIFFLSYLGRTMEPGKMAEGYLGTTIALAALGLRVAARFGRQRQPVVA